MFWMRHNDEAGLHTPSTGQDEDPGREGRMGFRLGGCIFSTEGRCRCRVMGWEWVRPLYLGSWMSLGDWGVECWTWGRRCVRT